MYIRILGLALLYIMLGGNSGCGVKNDNASGNNGTGGTTGGTENTGLGTGNNSGNTGIGTGNNNSNTGNGDNNGDEEGGNDEENRNNEEENLHRNNNREGKSRKVDFEVRKINLEEETNFEEENEEQRWFNFSHADDLPGDNLNEYEYATFNKDEDGEPNKNQHSEDLLVANDEHQTSNESDPDTLNNDEVVYENEERTSNVSDPGTLNNGENGKSFQEIVEKPITLELNQPAVKENEPVKADAKAAAPKLGVKFVSESPFPEASDKAKKYFTENYPIKEDSNSGIDIVIVIANTEEVENLIKPSFKLKATRGEAIIVTMQRATQNAAPPNKIDKRQFTVGKRTYEISNMYFDDNGPIKFDTDEDEPSFCRLIDAAAKANAANLVNFKCIKN